MGRNIMLGVSRGALLPLLSMAILVLMINAGLPRQVYAVAFQETDQDIINAHYNKCKDKYGPGFTRAEAANLDANCYKIPEAPEREIRDYETGMMIDEAPPKIENMFEGVDLKIPQR